MENHFRIFIRRELIRRSKANPSYSLRAFARYLHLEPSHLSKIINGKRRITPELIDKLGSRLKLPTTQLEQFKNFHAGLPKNPTQDYHLLAEDQFKVISDWYHYAILELMTTQGFKPDAKWIAKRLAISPREATKAIERLQRTGHIRIDRTAKKTQWHSLTGHNTTISNEFTTAALRKMQRQILSKAITALDSVPFKERDQSAMTLAISKNQISYARTKIRDFRRRLTKDLQRRSRRDSVYHLSISFYPVTQENP